MTRDPGLEKVNIERGGSGNDSRDSPTLEMMSYYSDEILRSLEVLINNIATQELRIVFFLLFPGG